MLGCSKELLIRDGHEPNHKVKFVTNVALFLVHELKVVIGLLSQTFKAVHGSS